MDYGLQLGRRFRALKLWFVLRHLGAEGIRERLRAHIALAQELRTHGSATSRTGRSWRRIRSRSSAFATCRRVGRSASSTRSTPRSCTPSTRPARSSSRTRRSTAATRSGWRSATCARSAADVEHAWQLYVAARASFHASTSAGTVRVPTGGRRGGSVRTLRALRRETRDRGDRRERRARPRRRRAP